MIDKVLKNRYRIIKKIGSGGMATVYKAEDTLLDRNVALKILRPQLADDEDFVKRFRREAKAAASLTHPNVVNIFDVGMEDDHYYIVMEYIYGKTLKQLISEKSSLEIEEAVDITKEISEALIHAHQNKIIHRDIKPHNILITPEGRVKVTDFGIARAASQATITYQSETVFGSAHYFSPEQARGGFTGEKSDIYSLGIVLYEMLTGQLPFTGETPVAVALKHLQEKITPPREINPSIPRELEIVLLKALEKEQASRYQNVYELLNDLNRCFGGQREVNKFGHDNCFKQDLPSFLDDSPTREIPVVAGESDLNGKNLKGSYSKSNNNSTADYSNTNRSRDYNNSYYNGSVVSKDPTPVVNAEDSSGNKLNGEKANMVSNKKRRKKLNKKTVTMIRNIVIIILVAGAVVYGINWGANKFIGFFVVPEVEVPDVEELSLSEAQEKIMDKELTSTVSEEISHSEVEAGHVVRQDPLPGDVIRQTREVELTISLGPEELEVPDVVGMQRRQAIIELEEEGFEVDITKEYKSDKPRDEVFEQIPAGGASSNAGSKVTIEVSKGGEPFEMPDFVNRLFEEVEEEAEEELELSIRNVYEEEELPGGIVLDQWPDSGEKIQPGDSVDFWVAEGKDMEELEEEYEIKEVKVDDLPQDKQIEVKIEDELGERVVFEDKPEGVEMTFEGYGDGIIEIKEFDEDGEEISKRMFTFP